MSIGAHIVVFTTGETVLIRPFEVLEVGQLTVIESKFELKEVLALKDVFFHKEYH